MNGHVFTKVPGLHGRKLEMHGVLPPSVVAAPEESVLVRDGDELSEGVVGGNVETEGQLSGVDIEGACPAVIRQLGDGQTGAAFSLPLLRRTSLPLVAGHPTTIPGMDERQQAGQLPCVPERNQRLGDLVMDGNVVTDTKVGTLRDGYLDKILPGPIAGDPDGLGVPGAGVGREGEGAEIGDAPGMGGTDEGHAPPTAGALRYDHGKAQLAYALAFPEALTLLARQMEYGSLKYEAWNFLKGAPAMQDVNSMLRHLMAWVGGEDTDPESHIDHRAGVLFAACRLAGVVSGGALDNRPGQILADRGERSAYKCGGGSQ